jgi:hypothetical protein
VVQVDQVVVKVVVVVHLVVLVLVVQVFNHRNLEILEHMDMEIQVDTVILQQCHILVLVEVEQVLLVGLVLVGKLVMVAQADLQISLDHL